MQHNVTNTYRRPTHTNIHAHRLSPRSSAPTPPVLNNLLIHKRCYHNLRYEPKRPPRARYVYTLDRTETQPPNLHPQQPPTPQSATTSHSCSQYPQARHRPLPTREYTHTHKPARRPPNLYTTYKSHPTAPAHIDKADKHVITMLHNYVP